jgi:hypothetical protein
MNSALPTLRSLLRNRRVVATLIVGSAFLALVCRTGLVRLHLVLLAAVEVAVAAEHGIALLLALHAEGLLHIWVRRLQIVALHVVLAATQPRGSALHAVVRGLLAEVAEKLRRASALSARPQHDKRRQTGHIVAAGRKVLASHSGDDKDAIASI